MSKVIKNNDGVAIVEGTPAASLIKDADKFFAAKVDTRMAGEAVQPKTMEKIAGRIDTRPGKGSEEIMAAAALTKPMMQMIDGRNTMVGYMVDGESTMFSEAEMNLSPLERADLLPERVKTAMQGGDPSPRPKVDHGRPVQVTFGIEGEKPLDPKAINTKTPTAADLEQMNNPPVRAPSLGLDEPVRAPSLGLDKGLTKTEYTTDPDAALAVNLAKDFKRQRSAKEAQRSQEERDATKGRFISTLRR